MEICTQKETKYLSLEFLFLSWEKFRLLKNVGNLLFLLQIKVVALASLTGYVWIEFSTQEVSFLMFLEYLVYCLSNMGLVDSCIC